MINDFKSYLLDNEKSKATLEKYVRDIRAFAAWLGSAELNKARVLEYKDYIIVKTYKGTKVPIEVTLQSKAYFDKQIPAYLLKQDNNVRKLFR